jgi:hypothetical protein
VWKNLLSLASDFPGLLKLARELGKTGSELSSSLASECIGKTQKKAEGVRRIPYDLHMTRSTLAYEALRENAF